MPGIGLLMLSARSILAEKPSIEITDIPTYEPNGSTVPTEVIAGYVSGIKNISDYKIVIYSFTNVWWVQPRSNSYDTHLYASGVNGQSTGVSSDPIGRRVRCASSEGVVQSPPQAEQLPGGDDIIAVKLVEGRKHQ
jgi:hypothetical protein